MAKESNLNVAALGVLSNDSQIRAIYNALRKDRTECTITWSYLRFEIALIAAQGIVTFPVLVNDAPAANANERRLNISDEFQVTHWGCFIYKKPDADAIYNSILNTYPNPATFAKTGEAKALQSLYNGYLTATIDRKQIIPYFDAFNFFKVPDSQLGTTTAAIAGPVQYLQANNAYLSHEWGFVEAMPSFRLSGSVVNQLQWTPAAPADMTGTTSTNYAVMFCRGFLIQGGAQFSAKKGINQEA